nr:flagellar hook-associated protein FlgK [Lachnospiraceae bacterium]
QAAINTTANNISNVNTEGYSRQEVGRVASAAQRCFTTYGSIGTGVEVTKVTQVRDLYYDEKYWNNNSRLGMFEKKLYYMNQIENYYTDNSQISGFTTLYTKMFNSLETVKTNAGDASVRNEFISSAQELMDYFNSTATSMQDLQSSINDEIKTSVDTINSCSKKIALLNKQINIIEMEGGMANELRDERARILDELSEIIPVEATEIDVVNSNYADQDTGVTRFEVRFNGNLIVDNYEYNTLSIVTRENKANQSDIAGLYDVKWDNSGAIVDFSSKLMEGELKAMFDIRDGNDEENLKGQVISTGSNTIKITSPTITEVEKMNMPTAGTVLVNSTYYNYTDFSVETDEDGNITSYTFVLDKPLTSEEQSTLPGKSLVNGKTVDFKGIPYYMNQMNEFLRSFSKAFNDMEKTGVDAYGNAMGSFFVAYDSFAAAELDCSDSIESTTFDTSSNTYYRLTCTDCRVAKASQKDPNIFATTTDATLGESANDLVDKLATLESDVKLFRGGSGSAFLQCIYADITVDAQECDVFTSSYTSVKNAIAQQRMSVSGVDEDDEAMDLIKFQNAYQLAAKCISTLTAMYDQLILNTGT